MCQARNNPCDALAFARRQFVWTKKRPLAKIAAIGTNGCAIDPADNDKVEYAIEEKRRCLKFGELAERLVLHDGVF